MLHICLIQEECCPGTAGFPTCQINTREMPEQWLNSLYLERCHKPWHLICVSDMIRGFHCKLCHWSDFFSPNESFGTSDASDKYGVVLNKVVKIKQQGCRTYEQQQVWRFFYPTTTWSVFMRVAQSYCRESRPLAQKCTIKLAPLIPQTNEQDSQDKAQIFLGPLTVCG